jgi:hypothetical protein
MTYWDDTTATSTITTKKEVWRTEIFGDIEGNFRFVAHVDQVRYDGGVEVGRVHLDDVTVDHDTAAADVNLEPHITAIRNRVKQLVRLLRAA